MGIRSIVLPIVSGTDETQGLVSAISVAKPIPAHIETVFMQPYPGTTYAYAGMGPSDRIEKLGKAAARHRRRFERLCRKAGLHSLRKPHPDGQATAGWREAKGDPAHVFPAAARREIRERGARSSGQILLDVTGELNCGLIVMGRYGRFRYSRTLFGGVTRHVIRHSPQPVLMMH